MHVGLIAESLTHPHVGVARYATNLAHSLSVLKSPDWQISVISSRSIPSVAAERIHVPNPFSRVSLSLAWQPLLRLSDRIMSLDVVHNPGHLPCPFRLGRNFVLTVPDISPIAVPAAHPISRSVAYSVGLGWSLRRAHLTIVYSEFVKAELLQTFRVSPSSIRVIPLAADPVFRQIPHNKARQVVRSYGINGPYFLVVGTLEPRKNLTRVLEAYAEAKQRGLRERLVLVGQVGWKMAQLTNMVHSLRVSGDVILTGYVPDKDLVALYNLSTALVFPSLYEGFGLPPLEAMQCGTPVVSSESSSLPEVVGNAGIMFNPLDKDSITTALWRVSEDPNLRDELTDLGLARSVQFSWRKTAEATLETYYEVCSSS